MVSGRITGRPLSFSATIMDIVMLIVHVNMPIQVNLNCCILKLRKKMSLRDLIRYS
uniref:Uncharacterized protein n=1 Tax=Salix viminalis TaxID=40686 RepID=A0A6N2L2D0_SALVM